MSRQQEARDSFLRGVEDHMVRLQEDDCFDLRNSTERQQWVDRVKTRALLAAGGLDEMTSEQIDAMAQGKYAGREREAVRTFLLRLAATAWVAARRLGLEDEIPF